MLKNIFVPKKEKITGDWRELYNWEVHGFCFASYIIQVTIVKEDERDRERGM